MAFEDWSKDDLTQYLQFLLYNYRFMDSFWYIYIEKAHGSDEANRINELVWGKVAQQAAKDLKARFNITEGGLSAFVRAQKLFPWCILADYQFEERDDEVIVSVPSCPTQEARLKRGLDEYPCQKMHYNEFSGFATAIDPRIKVECLFAPPDEHPPEMFCQWRFTLGE